jgi:hypothetical protein
MWRKDNFKYIRFNTSNSKLNFDGNLDNYSNSDRCNYNNGSDKLEMKFYRIKKIL